MKRWHWIAIVVVLGVGVVIGVTIWLTTRGASAQQIGDVLVLPETTIVGDPNRGGAPDPETATQEEIDTYWDRVVASEPPLDLSNF